MDGDLRTTLVGTDVQPVLVVSGEIDMGTAPEFEAAVGRLAELTDHARLDFADVTFLDSSGIKVLVKASLRAGTSALVIRNASEPVVRTLQICGLADCFLAPVAVRSPSTARRAVGSDSIVAKNLEASRRSCGLVSGRSVAIEAGCWVRSRCCAPQAGAVLRTWPRLRRRSRHEPGSDAQRDASAAGFDAHPARSPRAGCDSADVEGTVNIGWRLGAECRSGRLWDRHPPGGRRSHCRRA
jgi:anti-anti-sigma factor